MVLYIIAVVLQKISETLLILCTLLVLGGAVSNGFSEHWLVIAICLWGLSIALLGICQPFRGYVREKLNLVLLLSSITIIVILLALFLISALNSPEFLEMHDTVVHPFYAFGYFVILVPELSYRVNRFSLRTLVLSVLGFACCGSIIANRFYARIQWQKDELAIVERIRELKGNVEYENWRVSHIVFWSSDVRDSDFEQIEKLTSLKKLTFQEMHLQDSWIDSIMRMPALEMVNVGMCSSINKNAFDRIRKERPRLKVLRFGTWSLEQEFLKNSP